MRSVSLLAFGIGAASALLSGCGGGGGTPLNPSSAQQPAARHASALFSVIHSFAGGSDGVNPQAGLTRVKGVLYGTTGAGGANNQGTVFAIPSFRPQGTLYSFVG